jgi:hypothetical protein
VNGSAVTAKLTIETTSQEESKLSPPPPPRPRLGPRSGVALWAAWLALALALLVANVASSRNRDGGRLARLRVSLRLAALGMMLAVAAFALGCESYLTTISITSAASGTPSGNYTIRIAGTLGNNNSVSRTTTVNLSVGPG